MIISSAWCVSGCRDISFFQLFEFRRMRTPKSPIDQIFNDRSSTGAEMNEMRWLKLLQYFDAAGNMVIRDFHQSETLSVHHELRRMLKLSPLVEMVAVSKGIGVWEKGEDAEAESVAEQCELCC